MVRITFIVIWLCTFLSCTQVQERKQLRFTLLPPSATGITFANTIPENDSRSTAGNREYTRMGGGVGVGDFNRDGLPDLFFAGNEVSSRLYLNKGNCRFEDITAKARVSTTSWCTGVAVVDVNNDGWPDIYVCVSGKGPGARRKNLLFINQHDLTFKEEAAEYGLADTSCSTQAIFFDYDHDGRLDMYLVNHSPGEDPAGDIRDPKIDTDAVAADKLYHNEGILPGKDHPVFKDVSKQAGIIEDGDGLGAVIGDFNNDGWPDIYVNNDHMPGNLLWQNNHDGTFTNVIASALRHQGYSSTGVDAADLNNDGLTDIITLDRQPETAERKKLAWSFLTDQRHQLEIDRGYEPRYIHNMLQLNIGTRPPAPDLSPVPTRRPGAPPIPFFSEIAEMAGLAETDWSWSVLIADFDNDGWKDVHITNGLAHLAMRSYLFHNTGGLLFEDISESAGITEKGIATGAVYVDLDNDGDLDIVTNNIDGPAYIRRNDSGPNNYLTIRLTGNSANRDAIGATILAYAKHKIQSVSEYPVRGFLSSVDSRLHLGFGRDTADSLKITWPDGKQQLISHPAMNTILSVAYPAGGSPDLSDPPDPAGPAAADAAPAPLFADVTRQLNTNFRHKETFFSDYQFQPLILQKYSQEGPFISTGDLNGDGLDDFFIGGAFKQSGKLFFQNKDGTFTGRDLVSGVKYEEDMQSVIFDANGDKHPDLLVVGGSSEFDDRSPFYQPRLYLNDGRGNLRLDSMAFSVSIHTPAKCVAVADIDGDGYPDLFIGGRVSLGTYPGSCPSFILHNDHGRFTDVTARVCPALCNAGMLNAAVFTDLDGDGKPDLVLAGDWMPIRIFHNEGKTFREITAGSGLGGLPGFWRSLLMADVNHDGFPDIVAGNLGLDNPFHIRVSQPAELIAKDFDGNGSIDPVICYYCKDKDGKYTLTAGLSRDNRVRQTPGEMISGAQVLECKEVRSGWFENDGRGHFAFHPFPLMAQIAPVNVMVCTDVDGDGYTDLILGGNEYQAAALTGRYDASYGLLLRGDGHGGFQPVSPASDGLIIDGDVRDLKLIHNGAGRTLLTAINDQWMRAYRLPAP